MFRSLTSVLSEAAHEFPPIPVYRTGFPALDSLLGGISDADLVLITAKVGNRYKYFPQSNPAIANCSLYLYQHQESLGWDANRAANATVAKRCGPQVKRVRFSIPVPSNPLSFIDAMLFNRLNPLLYENKQIQF